MEYLKPHLSIDQQVELLTQRGLAAASLAGSGSLREARSSIAPLLYICRYLLRQIAPTSKWHLRVQDCLFAAQQKGINLNKMGLPEHWSLHPMWV